MKKMILVKIDSVIVTPFKTILKATLKKGEWHDYEVRVLDENNKELSMEKLEPSEDNEKEISGSLESIEESKKA